MKLEKHRYTVVSAFYDHLFSQKWKDSYRKLVSLMPGLKIEKSHKMGGGDLKLQEPQDM